MFSTVLINMDALDRIRRHPEEFVYELCEHIENDRKPGGGRVCVSGFVPVAIVSRDVQPLTSTREEASRSGDGDHV